MRKLKERDLNQVYTEKCVDAARVTHEWPACSHPKGAHNEISVYNLNSNQTCKAFKIGTVVPKL